MKVIVLAIGRLKEDYFRAAEAEYAKRLRPYCQLEIAELKDERGLIAAIPERALVCALDERGKQLSSAELAQQLIAREEQHGGGRAVVFAIGGPDGHTDAVRRRADVLLAFGKMTIAHRLVRLLVLEQLYRGFKIVRGEPYHRD